MTFAAQAEDTARLLAATPGWRRVQALRPDLDDATIGMLLGTAAKFAGAELAPLNTPSDRIGCRLDAGRVRTPPGFPAAYRRLGQAGWLAMDLAADLGGQGLPISLQAACQPLFERAAPAFMMAAGSARAAAHLLAEAAPDLARVWAPRLAEGAWAATICISEPDAGSDVGRIRTRAERTAGGWRITGEKAWISFGDHDMAERIGHCLLARSTDVPGTRGLSLFLVPNRRDDGAPNGVTVERLEEKLGLHGSPTCALRFSDAQATLIGEEGRGLARLFAMIERMRLLVGCQGLGIADGALAVARSHAAERRQGGPHDRPAVAIADHSDVRRQLDAMAARVAILRAAVLELAAALDLARLDPDAEARAGHAAFAAWMLPLVKTFGGEAGFETANAAIQVLGGAGYTRDWPVEQALRDARVLTIYEGATGMQAQDFLARRLWRDAGAGVAAFLDRARAEAGAEAAALAVLDGFEALARALARREGDPRAAGAADGYLRAGWTAVSAWLAVRLRAVPPLAGLAAGRLAVLPAEFALARAGCAFALGAPRR